MFGWGIARERLDGTELGEGERQEPRLPGAPIVTRVRLTTVVGDETRTLATPQFEL